MVRLGRDMTTASDNPGYVLLQGAIGEAVDCLSGNRLADKRVHAARKAVKKARTGLRLLRSAMTDAQFVQQNMALRDAARTLSPLRDGKSLLDAFDAFASRHAAELRGVRLAPLRRWLRASRAVARTELIDGPTTLRVCVDSLADCRERAGQSDLAHAGLDVTLAGLRCIYRRGRRAFAHARDAQTTEALHEWRKQVKQLFYAMDALRHAGLEPSPALVEMADRISDWLGDDHDLAMLHDAVRIAVNPDSSAIVHALIAKRRARLQKRALARGRRVFASKPGRFAAQWTKR